MQESQILPVTCSLQSHNSPDGGLGDLGHDEDDADLGVLGDLEEEDDGGDVTTCCLQTHSSQWNYDQD